MEPIASVKDQRLAAARALATRAGRVTAGRCLVEGAALWAVQEGVEDDMYADITAAEREQLRDLLHCVQDNAARLARPAGR